MCDVPNKSFFAKHMLCVDCDSGDDCGNSVSTFHSSLRLLCLQAIHFYCNLLCT